MWRETLSIIWRVGPLDSARLKYRRKYRFILMSVTLIYIDGYFVGCGNMDMDGMAEDVDPRLAARIVCSYAPHHDVPVGELSGLIAAVQQSLGCLGQKASVAEVLVPAVPTKRSVYHDYVVCLECGFRGRALRRHLRTGHGLDVAAYRARWKLSPDHVVIAPAYSAHRSALAKQIGLGRRPRQVEVSLPSSGKAPIPAPKQSGREWRSAAT
jgi:MucR family transcriptional regulator, transcriptional regulator of exopolysaccharide biosynthesis